MSSYQKKLALCANAKRATAIRIHQVENGDFVPYWLGRLNGHNVTMETNGKHTTRQAAVDDARRFRQACRNELARTQHQAAHPPMK